MNTVLYVGITNNLERRILEHRNKICSSFSNKYNLNKLVYYEEYEDVRNAIEREKQIKGGSRKRKIDLINSFNKNWQDLFL